MLSMPDIEHCITEKAEIDLDNVAHHLKTNSVFIWEGF